jgi:uncharacterized membrane protein (DUF4010 family)
VALATAVSFVRVAAIVAVLKPELLPLVGPPLLVTLVVAAVFAWMLARRGSDGEDRDGRQDVAFRNPFDFWSVIGFALLLALIILAGRLLGETLGAAGAIAGALALGLADVDAVTVSMSRLAPQPLSFANAALAILAAVASNTLAKIGLGVAVGRGAFAAGIAVMAGVCLAAGALAAWLAGVALPA